MPCMIIVMERLLLLLVEHAGIYFGKPMADRRGIFRVHISFVITDKRGGFTHETATAVS